MLSTRNLWIVVAAVGLATACQPAPRRLLTTDEKIADLYWVYSQFTENYAPLTHKEKIHSIDFATLKQKYLAEAATTKTNDEFYALLHRFVGEFKDAHTGGSLMASSNSPGRVSVAALGFTARREGDKVVVTDLLPTTSSATTKFPIKVGDKIVRLDGVPLKAAALAQSVYRHLGDEQANLTYHMPRLFLRQSISSPLPASPDAVVTVQRLDDKGNSYEVEYTLPWVTKDIVNFTIEQTAAKAKKEKAEPGVAGESLTAAEWSTLFQIGSLNGTPGITPSLVKNITHAIKGESFWNSFVFIDSQPELTSAYLKQALRSASRELKLENELTKEAAETAVDKLKKARNVPANVLWVAEAKTYPAYIRRHTVYDAAGKDSGQKKLVGTIYLDTFSPAGDEATVVKEVEATLKVFQAMGVEDVVVDLIDNGGGSLMLGAKIAQLFSRKKILMPEMQFALNETWIDDFENRSQSAASDSEKEVARRVFETLKQERAKGNRLSSRFPLEALTPYAFEPNLTLAKEFKVVLLVNEMCASMCDIFAATLQDNQLAKVVGTKSMGAGGNVVQVSGQAPNSNFYLNQTESLVLRRDGSYIENAGVTPDVITDVNAASGDKYAPVLERALEQLVGKAGSP